MLHHLEENQTALSLFNRTLFTLLPKVNFILIYLLFPRKGHRRRPVWCHAGLCGWTQPVQHVGPGTAPRGHRRSGQLLSLHARQRGSVDWCERGSVWWSEQSCSGDLRRSCVWFLKDVMSRAKYSDCFLPNPKGKSLVMLYVFFFKAHVLICWPGFTSEDPAGRV